MIIIRMIRLKALCNSSSICSRLLINCNIVNRLQDLHTEITFLQQKLKSTGAEETSPQWVVKCESVVNGLISAFQEAIDADFSRSPRQQDKAERVKSIALVQHELKVHRDKYSLDMQQLLICALDRVSQISTFGEVDEAPDWVISPHELDIVQVNSKSSLHTHEMAPAQWLNSVVKVSNFSVDQAKFVDAVDRWAYLSHPNVVNLFRVTHIKHPYAAVFENASYTNLLDYLIAERNQKFVWQKLHRVALGLKYLHDRGIILKYLNCQHIWAGTDGSAKINGFGIGIHEEDSAKRIQADRWCSPKVL